MNPSRRVPSPDPISILPDSLGKKTGLRPLAVTLLFALLMAAFMGAIFWFGIRSTQGKSLSPEHYATRLSSLLPFGYAFGAGLVASVNPCGFLMLPAFMGRELGRGTAHAGNVTFRDLGRGMLFGIMVTLGFVVLFAAIGSVVAAGGTPIVRAFPWVGFAVGILLAATGLWLLVTGRSFGLTIASRIGAPKGNGLWSSLLYGIAYGAASLSCTLPIFLVVVATALTRQGVLSSLGQFVSFALGMGTVILAVSLSAVVLRGGVTQALRGVVPHAHRLGAIFLTGAGAYLVVYWVVLGGIFR